MKQVRHRKTNTIWYLLYMETKKYKKLVNITKKKQTHRYSEQTSGYQWGEWRGEAQYVESKKMVQMNLFTKQKLSHRCRKQTYRYQKGKGQRDKLGDWDWHIHTTIYKIDS